MQCSVVCLLMPVKSCAEVESIVHAGKPGESWRTSSTWRHQVCLRAAALSLKMQRAYPMAFKLAMALWVISAEG